MKPDEIEELVHELDDRIQKLERAIQHMVDIKYRYSGLTGNGEVFFKPKEDFNPKAYRLESNKEFGDENYAVLDKLPEHLKKKLEWYKVSQKPEQGRWILYGNHRMVKMGRYGITLFENYKDEIVAYLPITHWTYLELPPAVRYADLWPKPSPEEASSTSSETQDSPGE